MKRALIWIIMCVFAAACTARAAAAHQNEAAPLCGVQCLLNMCARLGIAATLEELTELTCYNNKTGVQIEGLARAAQKKGLIAGVAKLPLSAIKQCNLPVIVQTRGGHYSIVEYTTGDVLMVADPPANPSPLAEATLGEQYAGLVLLVAKQQSDVPDLGTVGSDVRFDSYVWDFGDLYSGNSLSHVFRFHNKGTSDLSISAVEPLCGSCMMATDYDRTVPPGSEGRLTVVLSPTETDYVRGVSSTLNVICNDPVCPVVPLEIRGVIKPNRLYVVPRRIDLVVDPGQKVKGLLYVPGCPEEQLQVSEVSCDLPFLNVLLWEADNTRRPGWFITADPGRNAPAGLTQGEITIHSNHPRQPRTAIPISLDVRGAIWAEPNKLLLGILHEGSTISRAIQIRTSSEQHFDVMKVQSPYSFLSIDIVPKRKGKEYVLTATLKPDAPLGSIKTNIIVHTNDPDQPEIKIPVYAYVEEPEHNTSGTKPELH